jgi:hypothetical protein
MPQRFCIDEDRIFARGYDIVPVAIRCPKKVSGAYYSAHAPIKSARGRRISAGGRFYAFHPAVTVSSQNVSGSHLWLKRLSVHPLQKGRPLPFAVSGSRFVNHGTSRELKEHDSATMVVRIGQATTHINDRPGRLTIQESARKSRSIRHHPGQKFSDVIAPLKN